MLSSYHGLFAPLPPLHPVVFFEVLEDQSADLRSPLPEAEVTMPVLGDVQKFGVRRDLNYRFRRVARKVERGTPMPKPAELRRDIDELQDLVSKLDEAHDIYMRSIDLEKLDANDQEKYEKEEKVMEEAHELCLKNVTAASAALDKLELCSKKDEAVVESQKATHKTVTTLENLSASLSQAIQTPCRDIIEWDGSPLLYYKFFSMFENSIATYCSNDLEKIVKLLPYLKGDAADHTEHICYNPEKYTYESVKEMLRVKFALKERVGGTLARQALNGSKIKTASQWSAFATEMQRLNSLCTDLKFTQQIDTEEFLRAISMRLELREAERWRDYQFKENKIKKEKDSEDRCKFADFLKYITYRAERLNCPSVGAGSGLGDPLAIAIGVKSNHISAKGSNHTDPCVVCNQSSHKLSNCLKFKTLSYEKKIEAIKEARACFRCLLIGHQSSKCKVKLSCDVEGCNMRHHTLIHDPSKSKPIQVKTNVIKANTVSSDVPCHIESNVLLPIVKVKINNCPVLALLDEGSTNSLIDEGLVKRLKLTGKDVNVTMDTINKSSMYQSKVVSFDIQNIETMKCYHMHSVLTVPGIPARNSPGSADLTRYAHLRGIKRNGNHGKVEVLIGQSHNHLLIPDEIRRGNVGEPHATLTALGWAIQGPISNVGLPKRVELNMIQAKTVPQSVLDDITNLWSQEKTDETSLAWSREDQKVYDYWEKETRVVGGRYEVPIPFKDEHPYFPNNRAQALARLNQTVTNLKKKGTYETYDIEMRKLVENEYVEEVPSMALDRNDGLVWYLPHFPVYHPDKPDKTRPVMDAKCKYNGVSLNSNCLQGPDLNNKLIDILIRFREYDSALTGDIKAMYHQVLIPEQERDVLRFFWYNSAGKLTAYRWTRHIFGGIWCAASTTYALRRALKDGNADEDVNKAIVDNTYVDDTINSLRGEGNAAKLPPKMIKVLDSKNFTMCKFAGYPQSVIRYVPKELRAKDVKEFELDPETAALGIRWDTKNDTLFYRKREKDCFVAEKMTLRLMLSGSASIWDPPGYILPIVIVGRLLFQEASRLGLGWDNPLPEELASRWLKWWQTLDLLPTIIFPRCMLGELYDATSCDLHHFCDASERAYGAAAYVRVTSPDGRVHVCLIRSRGRVAPVKTTSIPRLELCGAVAAVELDQELRREMTLRIDKSTFWCDSEIVLKWIRNETLRLKIYVANRVALITTHSNKQQWRHVPTKMNPADILSRGSAVDALPEMWNKGPDFLHSPENLWPVEGMMLNQKEESTDELFQAEVISPKLNLNQVSLVENHPIMKLLVYYHEDYEKLRRSMAWLNRLAARCKKKLGSITGPLTREELIDAELTIIRWVQSVVYEDELNALKNGTSIKKSSSLLKLNPQLRDDVIVVGGRLQHALIPESQKHPIIIPKKHLLSKAILSHYHRRAHLGSDWVLTQVKEKYHIPGARSMLRSIRKTCVRCNRYFSQPQHQLMAELPPERLQPGIFAFAHAGLDLFGNFYVKIGRARHKRYGVIFTCMASRAVHIEVVHSLEAQSFIMAFQRFCARRGTPVSCKSDRGTNIVGATEDMRKAWINIDVKKITDFTKRNNVQWQFNTPKNSEAGGVWERQIRTIRKTLLGVLDPNMTLTDEILQTYLTEAENLINSRPITRVSDEPLVDALTPNHLLVMQGNSPHSLVGYDDSKIVRSQWKQVTQLTENFWRRWHAEYLHTLQQRQKWNRKLPNIKVGELVMLVEPNLARGQWPLGIIEKLKPSSDGLIRSVSVRTAASTYDRPLGKLVKLELDCNDTE